MIKILKYSFLDLIRSNWVLFYTIFFLVISFGLLVANGEVERSIVSLLNIIVILIPLIATVFGVIYYYNSRDFVEMLLSQPVKRYQIFLGQFLGLSLSLSFSFVVGITLPFISSGLVGSAFSLKFIYLIAAGTFLTFIFCGFAYYLALKNDNRLKGFGFAILLWLFLAIIYDGLFVILLVKLEDYPLESFSLISTMLNPIDLSRVFILLKFDTAALFGYTGALFQKFFGSYWGILLSGVALFVWSAIPLILILSKASKKDF